MRSFDSAALPSEAAASAPRCVVADDDPGVLQLMQAWLGRYHVQVLTADSAEAALALIEGAEVQLLVTDLVMEGMDGIELLRRLARLPGRPKVLGITGAPGGESLGLAFTAMGAEAFLLKPFTREQFLAALQQALGRELRPR